MPQQPEDRMNDPALDALAGALRGLAPRPGKIDRDRLMFQAGRASAPRGWAWPLATVASAAAAAVLGVLLWARPESPPRTVYVQTERPATASDERASGPDAGAAPGRWSHYLQLQEDLLRDGLDGLPAPSDAPAPEGQQTVDALLKSL
jgi:hypothetical protein